MSKVYLAINAVQADLAKSGISKDSTNAIQGYKFRGIDAVYGAVAPLLAKHKLCILPRATERVCTERTTQKGTVLFSVAVKVEYDLVSAEDGSKHTVVAYGEAMDSGDKSSNKAMSAAYKYACLQTFCIPTEGDNDADASTHEGIHPSSGVEETLSLDQQTMLQDEAERIESMVGVDKLPKDAAKHLESLALEPEAKVFLWKNLSASTRALLKKTLQEKK